MIRLGSSTRTACAVIRLGTVGKRRASSVVTKSAPAGSGAGRSRVLAAGAILAGAAATTYILNKKEIVYNDGPIPPAIEVPALTTTDEPPKLSDDGRLHTYVWGSNKYKTIAPQLAKDSVRSPQEVPAWTGVALRDLSLHEKHAACVDAVGDVYQWGHSYHGDLPEGQVGEPQRTLSGKNISKIALSAARVFALSEKTGKIYVLSQAAERQKLRSSDGNSSWWSLGGWFGGSPSVGYLELSTDSKMNRGEKFVSISAGRDHLIALTSHGRTFALPISLSANTYGQLGFRKFTLPDISAPDPSTTPRISIELTPRALEDPHALATPFVRSGHAHTSTFVDPGISFCDLLFEVPSLRGLKVVQALAGDRCSYVRTSEGRILAWGANSYGQLGLGATAATEAVTIPTEVVLSRNYPGGTNVQCTSLAAGGDIAYFVVNVTTPTSNVASVDVLACGMGQWGGLGNGLFSQAQGAPVKVKTVSGVIEYNEATRSLQPLRTRSISVSPAPQSSHTLITLATGALAEAPENHSGHPAGNDLLVLGYNADGQLGNGKRSSLCIPSHIPALGGMAGRMMLRERARVALVDLQGRKCGTGRVEETAVAGWGTSAIYWRIV
ncbi:hypothetical protein FRC12_014448 [Ceratobasidium sp. 428]|nr:hypothetical protein FRC12_014448 [Ceratobasidium sp. 428]